MSRYIYSRGPERNRAAPPTMRCIGKFKRSFANDHLLLAYLLATPVELGPNAGRQARRAAVARHERRLAAVACTPGLGAWDGRDTVLIRLLHRHLPHYCFNSFFSSFRKRQSVPWAMIFWGLLLIIPASCRRRA